MSGLDTPDPDSDLGHAAERLRQFIEERKPQEPSESETTGSQEDQPQKQDGD